MKTKADFQQLIANSISSYPVSARFYQANDPRLLSQLDAIATMLAMLSTEQDVAAMEPFLKARDMTVLADAAVKGVLPFGAPTLVAILVENSSTQPVTIVSGRVLLDAQGRLYSVTLGAVIAAGGTGVIIAIQRSSRTVQHTITVSTGYYQIEVPAPEVGYIAGVLVSGVGSTYTYTPDFVNVEAGERVYHLKTDEFRRLFVQFGATNVSGYQPPAGDVITLTITDTEGAIDLAVGTQFTFEYAASVFESGLKMTMQEVKSPGAAPMDIATMREVCSYPSTYDGNAVYLGNFDFLVRRELSPFTFLSIWNEQREEEVRGPSQDNINKLFVSARKEGVDDATLRTQIERIIAVADDSYGITHVPIEDVEVEMDLTLQVQSIYDAAVVAQDARTLILGAYGPESAWAKRGEAKILYKDVYDLLTGSIQALQDRFSDMRFTVDLDDDVKPEQFRRITEASLTITVEAIT